MANPTVEDRRGIVTSQLPWLRGNFKFLRRILDAMKIALPELETNIRAFRLYYCLDSEEVLTLTEVGETIGTRRQNVRELCHRVLRKLKSDKRWHDKNTWPQRIVEPMPLGATRIVRIAMSFHAARFNTVGPDPYLAELKRLAVDLAISEEELILFFAVVRERASKL